MLKAKIESILFVINRPLTVKKLSEILGTKRDAVTKAVDELADKYNQEEGSGIRILRHGGSVQMATSPETAKTVQDFLKDETTGELTKPSLETLTIVAYRGPIAKGELEELRGVNCSLILRNLMLRGLVEVQGEHGNPGATYSVTMDFLRFLGVAGVEELPDYGKLNSHENIVRVLEKAAEEKSAKLTEEAAKAKGNGSETQADGGAAQPDRPDQGSEGEGAGGDEPDGSPDGDAEAGPEEAVEDSQPEVKAVAVSDLTDSQPLSVSVQVKDEAIEKEPALA